MTVSIVACGDSAKEWYKVPCDLSIGVNDCLKFGHEVNHLVVVNSPIKFHPMLKNGYVDRLKIITNSKPQRFFCHDHRWKAYFPQAELLGMRSYNGTIRPGRIYSSRTSPFVAITLAASLGAKDIILWGIDMLTHHTYKPGKKEFESEFFLYRSMFDELKKLGVNVWLGNNETVLKDHVPVYWASTVLKGLQMRHYDL